MINTALSINLLNTIVDLINTESSIISFTCASEILTKKTGVKLRAVDITRWLREAGYLECDSSEQNATQLALELSLLVQSESTFGGKKRKSCSLTLRGLVFLIDNVYTIIQFKEAS